MATATTRPAPRSADAGRRVLLLHLVLSPLLFCTWTSDVFEGPKAALLTAAALVLAGLAASAWIARGAPLRLPARPDLLTLGMILFVVSAALSTIFSISPLISWRGAPDSHAGLQTLLAYLVLYLATRGLCRTAADGRRLLGAAVVGAALSSVYALIQAARLDPAAWDGVSSFADHDRPFGMFGHANYLSAYLVMAAPLIAVFVLRAVPLPPACGGVGRAAALTLALVAVLAGVAVVAGLSRAAWLAGGVALLALGGGWFLAGRRRAALALAGLAAVVAMAGWWAAAGMGGEGLSGRVAERLSRLGDGAGRWQIWRAAAELFHDRPLAGWGTDTFQVVFGKHRPADYADAEWGVTPTRAHNVALQVLATQGLLGAAAAVALIAGLGLAAVRAWRRSSPDDRPTVAAVAAMLAAFLVQDLFGFTVVGCGSLFVTGAALLSRWGDPSAPPEPTVGKSFGLLGGLLTGGGLAVLLFLLNVGWSGVRGGGRPRRSRGRFRAGRLAGGIRWKNLGERRALCPPFGRSPPGRTRRLAQVGVRPARGRRPGHGCGPVCLRGPPRPGGVRPRRRRPGRIRCPGRGAGELRTRRPAGPGRRPRLDAAERRRPAGVSAGVRAGRPAATAGASPGRLDPRRGAGAGGPLPPRRPRPAARRNGGVRPGPRRRGRRGMGRGPVRRPAPRRVPGRGGANRPRRRPARPGRALDRPRPGTLPAIWTLLLPERGLRPGRRSAGRGRRRPGARASIPTGTATRKTSRARWPRSPPCSWAGVSSSRAVSWPPRRPGAIPIGRRRTGSRRGAPGDGPRGTRRKNSTAACSRWTPPTPKRGRPCLGRVPTLKSPAPRSSGTGSRRRSSRRPRPLNGTRSGASPTCVPKQSSVHYPQRVNAASGASV